MEPRLSKLDNVIEEITESERLYQEHKAQELIENRKYIIATILETYGTWSNEGDCLPKEIKFGGFGNKWIEIKIVDRDTQ